MPMTNQIDIKYCRERLSSMSREDGEPLPPDYPWFWMSYRDAEDRPDQPPTGNTDQQLADAIRDAGESEGYDIMTAKGLEATLKVMYYG